MTVQTSDPSSKINFNNKEYVVEINIDQIILNPYQPRSDIADSDIQHLAESIKAVGIIQPPVVRAINGSDNYELIAGERRLRAAIAAGLKTISVVVNNMSSEKSAQTALIENVQRVDLNALEVAKALRNLIGEFGYSQEDIALKIGKKRSTISNYLRLLKLPRKIQDSLSSGEISMGHAKAILSLTDVKDQGKLHRKIIKDNMNVRQAEILAVKWSNPEKISDKDGCRLNQLSSLEKDLCLSLKLNVDIKGDDNAGKISINYKNRNELDQLVAFLKSGE